MAPAGPPPPEVLQAGIDIVQSWGLRVRVGKHVLDRHPTLDYLAGSDADRAADLQDAWCDPEVAAVFCVRGGYGCLRMVDLVDWSAMAAAGPKVFAGSSDVTVLHEFIGARLGLVTLFAPMLATLAFTADEQAQRHLRSTLFDPDAVRVLTRPGAGPLVAGKASGVVVGGNASLLAAGLAAKAALPAPDGAIAVLEDVNEDPYRLDAIVTKLLRAGWFDGVTGIALGSWADCGELAHVRATLLDRLGGLGVPIAWELGFGHCPAALTVPLGLVADLDAVAGTLTMRSSALR
ncbi:LD-carboxypeptidase [Kutzneria kofuensis]|uniref:Muramoyltetrapeptide carboxypeptidase n=1 Tax=Kutzneria kofuensis TaxID=103725 RepID=A0A7W9KSQ3_9PSEU|nr:LD-carboxypeptidase [Kutzneria kofuensis]MBB5897723.1 muramoyltetrapeptide carboxypeptidase [Kutzneria kofuensis]